MNYVAVVEPIAPSVAKIFTLNKGVVSGTGSGFLFSKAGIMVTCDHVVGGSETLVCRFSDEDKFYTAKLVVRDQEHDLALLKVEDAEARPVLAEGEQDEIKAGMSVLFSGYPLNLETLTTHQGILSSITTDAVGITTYLIDGTVNSGNSGCPLMDNKGRVIGVVNAKRQERADLLNKVERMALGAVAIHGVDLVEIYQALISNVQLGIGYAVPASYIPEHKELAEGQLPIITPQSTDKDK
ncbi:MAG: trypsin-like peptidase domain-containing protein [Patescibacteria group bacterium]